MTPMPAHLVWLIALAPLAGFLVNGILGARLPKPAVTFVALASTAISFALDVWLTLTFRAHHLQSLATGHRLWISAGSLQIPFSLYIDHLTLVMLAVVTGVGFLIHIYSVGYMAHEEGFHRFFAYLNLFMFFMLVLVLAANFLLLFVGWEGVGLASYLLIGFYFQKDSAANAGKKAFIVNRIGDLGFLIAIFLILTTFGSLTFTTVFAAVPTLAGCHCSLYTAIALLLMLGAAGKSAQVPLYVWLPDAMEGPTPVSALIHAATMVTAGVYMVARCHVLFDQSPVALAVVAAIGAFTAIFAASIGLVQTDIKRVLAYSTVSQLGYMFLACGVGAYSAAIFHLFTHAFFKALLFLAAGSVIHALGGEQNLHKMGGLRTRIPVTFWTMTFGVFAIAGFPPFAGFFSKDEILYRTFTSNLPFAHLFWLVGAVTALLTSFYMFRLWYLAFFSAPRFDEHTTHPHESPRSMLAPLAILATLSLVGGWANIPAVFGGSARFTRFLAPVLGAPEESSSRSLELNLAFASVLIAILGLILADYYFRRRPAAADRLAQSLAPIHSLLLHKYWVDEIYAALIIKPLLFLSRYVLGLAVDTGLVNGSAAAAAGIATGSGSILRRVQSGNIRSYAGWLAAAAAVLIAVAAFGRALAAHIPHRIHL
jgi:NADH-quinone oxidoreductase subunit L